MCAARRVCMWHARVEYVCMRCYVNVYLFTRSALNLCICRYLDSTFSNGVAAPFCGVSHICVSDYPQTMNACARRVYTYLHASFARFVLFSWLGFQASCRSLLILLSSYASLMIPDDFGFLSTLLKEVADSPRTYRYP